MENKLYASHTFFATFLNLRFHIFTFIFSYYAFSFHPSHHPNRTFTIFIFSTLFCVYLLLLLLCVRRAKEKQINVYIFILFSLISHSPARFQKKITKPWHILGGIFTTVDLIALVRCRAWNV